MENLTAMAMIDFFGQDLVRINHLLKVHGYATIIAKGEKVDDQTMRIIEIVSYCHDIGIKVAEDIYGYNTGKMQEEYGPEALIKMFESLGVPQEITDRVALLVGCHHTYHLDLGIDYQILIEADALVNIFENNCTKAQIEAYRDLFKTATGIGLLEKLYL